LNFLIKKLIKKMSSDLKLYTMSSDLNIFIYDFMERKRPAFFDAIHALNDNARLPDNIFGEPIKCYTCDCRFHVNKDCIKYNKQKRN